MSSTALVWFTNNLRVSDNSSLINAHAQNDRVIAVYCFDPRHFEHTGYGFKKTEYYRTRFLLETMQELRDTLQLHNITLFTYVDLPENILPKVIESYSVNNIYFQKEWTKEECDVINNVKKNTSHLSLQWNFSYDQFLYHPEDLPIAVDSLPKVFTDFRKQCEKQSRVRESVSIPKLPETNLIINDTLLPTLEDLGYQARQQDFRSAFPFKGGTLQAQKRINEYFWQSQQLSTYKKTRNGLMGTEYSSKLSAWLANGSISARTIYWEVKKYEKEVTKNDSTYWLVFELMWRDFFKYVSLKHGNDIFKIGGILNKSYTWSTDKEEVNAWIHGQTDEPFVNANMIELRKTGWMSNRGRQNVASYFAKELQLDWRIGAAYFEAYLIDYDVHSNYGNWMYVAGVGNDPRDRKFNIASQADRYDPQQEYQQIWLEPSLF
ncbi:DASH family cryptochrome [Aquimarina intermedia]|uniref:Cryptochrome DASH n=1 Tax=Aquimarina intermedia TaxID=350814 RepID=A0A5S5CDD6_9FLAO|nr:DASH family cryptochrome [Aquimarina intermedia]TYP77347.1 deoxyribodipyrimidine photo-lyase (single-stranded DNA-specific) [Aquimarina intermedia]